MVRELVNYGANVNAQSQVEWPGVGKAPSMHDGGVFMVPSMGTSAALYSFSVVLFRGKDCSARLLKEDECVSGGEGVLRDMGRPAWSLC